MSYYEQLFVLYKYQAFQIENYIHLKLQSEMFLIKICYMILLPFIGILVGQDLSNSDANQVADIINNLQLANTGQSSTTESSKGNY